MLTQMGVGRLTLLDPDTVGEENLAPQGFANNTVGSNKANVVRSECVARKTDDAVVDYKPRRFGRADKGIVEDAHVFSCVDTMTSRRLVWEACVAGGAKWFGDARAAGETVQVITESDVGPDSLYYSPDVLFDDSEAFVGQCSTKMTCFTAAVAASYLVARFAQNLRGAKLGFNNVRLNLLFDDLSEPAVRPPEKPKPVPVEQVLNEVLDLNPPVVFVPEPEPATAV
jgi:molybdopterin/thiamine biosynthesis adenylyltransferase